jgi:outer membrane receptor protein involved in Fe transport
MDPFLVQGCTPINPFGQTMSEAAHDYAFDPLEEFNTIDQQVLAGGVNGQLWEGWGAGPMLAAAGLEYRFEAMDNDTYKERPPAHALDTSVSFGTNWSGESTVAEGFFEVEMPLLTDKPMARTWVINAAARRTRYENTELERTNGELTGTEAVTSWKFQSIWEPVDWFRLRGSQSRDIRAAGFRELFYQQLLQKGATNGRVTNVFNNNTPDDLALVILSGYPALTPEKADTTTMGMVFSPGGFAENLQLSIDYYTIQLEDGIIRGGSARVLDNCLAEYNSTASLDGEFCSLVTFLDEGNGPILSDIEEVIAPYYNDQPYEARGIDYSAQYRLNLDGGGLLDLRLLASRALEQTILVGSDRQERNLSGMVGGGGFLPDYTPAPEWTANLVIGYSRGAFRITTRTSYISESLLDKVSPYIGPDDSRYDPTRLNSIITNVVESHVTQDVNVSYDFGRAESPTQLWLSVNNIWDQDPPFAQGSTGGANGSYYDILGRMYRVGVRFNF